MRLTMRKPESRLKKVRDLMNQKEQHYQSVKQLFHKAIVELTQEEEEDRQSQASSNSDPRSPARNSSPGIFEIPSGWPPNNRGMTRLVEFQGMKRRLEDLDEPAVKRRRLGVPFRRDGEPTPEPETPTASPRGRKARASVEGGGLQLSASVAELSALLESSGASESD
jgi:hypothetical protein